MSVAGKKLQDIYDAGAKQLAEMDRNQRSVMDKSVDGSTDSSKSLGDESTSQLQQRSQECESDVQATLTKTMQQIQQVIAAESLETENRLAVLKDNISALSKKLNDSIFELTQQHEARLNVVSEDVANLCEREFDNAAAEVHIQDYSSAKTLKVQNTFILNTFQQKLDHGLLETRGEEKQITVRISKSFLQSVNTIDTHTSAWTERLSQAFDSHSQALEEQFTSGDTELESRIAELVKDVDKQAEELQQKIHEHFEHTSFELKDKSDGKLESLVAELKSAQKSAADDLAKLLKELNGELESACEVSYQRLRQTSIDLKGKVNAAIDSVEDECGKRRETSLGLKRDLEERARVLIDGIKQELSELHSSFEQRLKKLIAKSGQDLNNICSEAEAAIATAQSDCEGQFKTLSDKAKEQIQTKLSELLLRIKKQQDLALEEVIKVASGNTPDLDTHNPAPKKSKKKKNSAASDRSNNAGGDR
jgi:hypothetical protein